jgi:hypothetical protein
MRKFQRKALQRAKAFDMENCAKQLVKVYEQAIEDKAAERHVTIEAVEE